MENISSALIERFVEELHGALSAETNNLQRKYKLFEVRLMKWFYHLRG